MHVRGREKGTCKVPEAGELRRKLVEMASGRGEAVVGVLVEVAGSVIPRALLVTPEWRDLSRRR